MDGTSQTFRSKCRDLSEPHFLMQTSPSARGAPPRPSRVEPCMPGWQDLICDRGNRGVDAGLLWARSMTCCRRELYWPVEETQHEQGLQNPIEDSSEWQGGDEKWRSVPRRSEVLSCASRLELLKGPGSVRQCPARSRGRACLHSETLAPSCPADPGSFDGRRLDLARMS